MMTKPKPETSEAATAAADEAIKKKAVASNSVADLERRLAELGNPSVTTTTTTPATTTTTTIKPAPATTTPAVASASATTNKTALLVRVIIQEVVRTKQKTRLC